MKKTPEELRAAAEKLLKQADAIERISKPQQPKRMKPRIPDDDPEAQALVREKFRLGMTHAGVPLNKAQLKKLTGD